MKKTAQTVISADKYYTITAANGKVVEVADYNTENGAAIQLWDYAGEEWQQWSFVRAGDGVYRICNRFTGKMLDLIAGGVVDGTEFSERVNLRFHLDPEQLPALEKRLADATSGRCALVEEGKRFFPFAGTFS